MPSTRARSATFVVAATVAAGMLLAGPAAATARPDHPHHPGRTAHASHSARSSHGSPAYLALASSDRAERGSHGPDRAHSSANQHRSDNGRGIGRLLGQLAGTSTGLINGASRTVNGVTHTTGTLLGAQPGTRASTPPQNPTGPASPSPHASSRPAGPASGARPASAHREALATGRDAVAKHQPRLRAAPAEMPALVGQSPPEVDHTASPVPSPTAAPAALPVLPASAVTLLAPRVWVLVLAIGLFALGVLFLVLGAGYRGRRAR